MLDQAATTSCEQDVANYGRRAAARLRLSIPAQLVSIYATHDCILLDLSRTGARVALAEPLAVGEGGYLRIGRLEVFCEAVRAMNGTGGGLNGLVFDDPLSNAEVLETRHHAETFEQSRRFALREQVRKWVAGEK
jgi:hypothetical protein